MTDTNIRQAILKAADHIEANPSEFNFYSIAQPRNPGCGTPGCALGWISCFLGVGRCNYGERSWDKSLLKSEIGVDDGGFYKRMNGIGAQNWIGSPTICAAYLRIYADRYHPEVEKSGTGVSAELTAELDRIFSGVTA